MSRWFTAVVYLLFAVSLAAQAPPEEPALLESPPITPPSPEESAAMRTAAPATEGRPVTVQATEASPLDLTGTSADRTMLRFFDETAERARIESLGTGNAAYGTSAGALRLWNSTAAPMIFGTGGVERMRIFADGNVTIGSTSNVGRLASVNYTSGGRALWLLQQATIDATPASAQNDYGLITFGYVNVNAGVTGNGSVVGIHSEGKNIGGGTQPTAFGARLFSGNLASSTGTVSSAYGAHIWVQKGGGAIVKGYGLYVEDVQADTDYGIYQANSSDDNYFAGNIGLGTLTPQHRLHVYGNENTSVRTLVENASNDVEAHATIQARADVARLSIIAHSSTRTLARFGRPLAGFTEVLNFAGNGLIIGTDTNRPLILGSNNQSRIFVEGDGDVGIGIDSPGAKLHVNGNVLASGSLTVVGDIVTANGSITGARVIGAVYQDVAEWVPASVGMEAGTVVVLNEERINEVMPSHTAYDTSVAGVVSAQPGVLLGVAGASKEMIATTGRVKVRVDATRAPIRVGDLLVTSDVPGTAMRSEPMQINGRRFHQPGTIIGKALEPLQSGTGEVLVLLSLQ